MKPTLRWLGRIVGVLTVLAVVTFLGIYFISESRLNQVYSVPVANIQIPTDPAGIARGEHLVNTIGFCRDCHGEKLEGRILDDDPLIGQLVAPNLTFGIGGKGKTLSDGDWVRALRHGVGTNGKPLIFMSSNVYTRFSDADLGAIIAYLKTIPSVDNTLPQTQIRIIARYFILTDPALVTAESIDHQASHTNDPQPGVNAAYGKYLSVVCQTCHGENFGGKSSEGGGLNLTPGGGLGKWTQADFVRALRIGITPTGKRLDNAKMPWRTLGNLTDDELAAIWLYLQSLPPVPDHFPTPIRTR